MSNRFASYLTLAGVISLQLMTSGCLGLGGGAAGLFAFLSGGNSQDSGSSTVASLLSGGNGGSGDASDPFSSNGGNSSSESSGESGSSAAATIHNPEPGSLILFGGGLAGLSAIRRRKKHRL